MSNNDQKSIERLSQLNPRMIRTTFTSDDKVSRRDVKNARRLG